MVITITLHCCCNTALKISCQSLPAKKKKRESLKEPLLSLVARYVSLSSIKLFVNPSLDIISACERRVLVLYLVSVINNVMPVPVVVSKNNLCHKISCDPSVDAQCLINGTYWGLKSVTSSNVFENSRRETCGDDESPPLMMNE